MESFKEKIYNWMTKMSEKTKFFWLAFLSFIECSFFPIPADPFLMLAIFSKPKSWFKYTFIVSVFSVVGGLFGYLIGFFFFDLIGEWVISTYGLESHFEMARELFEKGAFWAVLISAFTPIPYKIFTIASGFFAINLFQFVIASIIGRSARFFIVGAVSYFLGKNFAKVFIKYFDIVAIVLVIAIILFLFL